jgi:DNA primase
LVAAERVEFVGAPVRFYGLCVDADPFALASAVSDVDLITKVKASVRIESLFGNVHRTSTDGRWFAAICPFHDDHNPSLWIDARRQLCGCNVCGMKPMDAVNLYARMHNVSESVAVGELAREVGIWR